MASLPTVSLRPRTLLAALAVLVAGWGSGLAQDDAGPSPTSGVIGTSAPTPTAVDVAAAARWMVTPTVEEWEPLTFWHRLARIRPNHRDRPGMQELCGPILARDPDDLLANFLQARTLYETLGEAPGDSATLARIETAGAAPGASPGELVAAASVYLARRDVVPWRSHIDRAHAAYAHAGREAEVFQCLLLKSNFRAGQRDAAVLASDLEELRVSAEASDDPVRIADHRILLGKAEYTENLERSVAPRAEAVRLLTPGAPRYQLAYAHWGLGNSLRRLGRLEEARGSYEDGLRVARAVSAPDLEADCHLGLGQVLRRQGHPADALVHYEASGALLGATGDYGGLVATTLNFRGLYHELGDHAAARRSAEEALRLAREYGSNRAFVSALDGWASEEAILGRLDRARQLYEEAIREAHELGGRRELIYLHYHLSGLESDLADLDSAERIARAGLEIATELGDTRGRDLLELRLVQITLHRGEYEAALAAATELAGRPKMVPSIRQDAVHMQAQAVTGLGRLEEALAIYDGLVAGMEEGGAAPSKRTRVLSNRGHLLLEMDRVDAAIESFEEARRLAEGDPNFDFVAAVGLGAGLSQAGRWEEALPLLEEGLAVVERTNSGLTVGEERSGFLVAWYDDYVRLAQAYLEVDRPADAFAVLERARARELRRALRSGAPGLEVKVTPELAADLARIEGELSSVQSSLVEQYARDPADRLADLAALESRADELKRLRGELVATIERERPRFAREIGLSQIGLAEFQARLAPDEVVLATMSGRRTVLVFAIGRGSFGARSIAWPEDEVRATVSAAVDAVRGVSGADGDAAAGSLAARLLPEVEAHGPRALFVLPDGAFHRLPFEVLPLSDGRRLVEAAEVSYASSATLLVDSSEPASAPSGGCVLVAFGDPAVAAATAGADEVDGPGAGGGAGGGGADGAGGGAGTEAEPGTRGGLPVLRALPHARREVTRLGELLDEACVRVGEEATEGAFFREAAHAPVVHVAAHAFVDDAHPGYSGIVLASDPEGTAEDPPRSDGIVQAFEVVRADIPASLVTLSACETGGGAWQRGEGLIGLARAFRIAGARSLVVSLWEVDDEATADFMVRLYEQLIDGVKPAAALRAAKLSFLAAASAAPSGRTSPPGLSDPASSADPPATRGVVRRTQPARPAAATWAAFVLLGPGPNPFPPAR